MKRKTNQELMGDIAEKMVCHIYDGIRSSFKYDMKKDCILQAYRRSDDDTPRKAVCEVKAQNRHPTKHCFSIDSSASNQLYKCIQVELLLFVEYDYSDIIKVWECVHKNDYYLYRTNPTKRYPEGLTRAGWNISDMLLVKEIKNKYVADYMRSLSQSTQFRSEPQYAN